MSASSATMWLCSVAAPALLALALAATAALVPTAAAATIALLLWPPEEALAVVERHLPRLV
jgi:hypothetical protein